MQYTLTSSPLLSLLTSSPLFSLLTSSYPVNSPILFSPQLMLCTVYPLLLFSHSCLLSPLLLYFSLSFPLLTSPHLSSGSIPTTLANLQLVKFFLMSANRLSGVLPQELCKIAHSNIDISSTSYG